MAQSNQKTEDHAEMMNLQVTECDNLTARSCLGPGNDKDGVRRRQSNYPCEAEGEIVQESLEYHCGSHDSQELCHGQSEFDDSKGRLDTAYSCVMGRVTEFDDSKGCLEPI